MDRKEFKTIIETKANEYVNYVFRDEVENAPYEAVSCARGDFLEGAWQTYELLSNDK